MQESTLAYLFVFFLALILGLVIVPVIRRLALRFKIVDSPGDRKTHKEAIPCLGGLAIYIIFVVVVVGCLMGMFFLKKFGLTTYFFTELSKQTPLIRKVSPQLFALLGGATAILLIGLLDDLVGVKFDFRLKFFLQGLVAVIMVLFGIQIVFLPSPFLNAVLTVIWIVGITNAFNLLDNMDGLAGGVAYICAMLFFFTAARQGQFFIGLIYLSLSGSLLAFLYYNFYPAKIFLGDTGSLFIGFVLSSITVLQSFGVETEKNIFPILMPLIILSLPIFDTIRVILIRLSEKRPIFQGDRCHISHRLVDMGMGQPQAVITVYLMTLSLGIGCTILDLLDSFTNSIILVQAFFIILTLICLMVFTRRK